MTLLQPWSGKFKASALDCLKEESMKRKRDRGDIPNPRYPIPSKQEVTSQHFSLQRRHQGHPEGIQEIYWAQELAMVYDYPED